MPHSGIKCLSCDCLNFLFHCVVCFYYTCGHQGRRLLFTTHCLANTCCLKKPPHKHTPSVPHPLWETQTAWHTPPRRWERTPWRSAAASMWLRAVVFTPTGDKILLTKGEELVPQTTKTNISPIGAGSVRGAAAWQVNYERNGMNLSFHRECCRFFQEIKCTCAKGCFC